SVIGRPQINAELGVAEDGVPQYRIVDEAGVALYLSTVSHADGVGAVESNDVARARGGAPDGVAGAGDEDAVQRVAQRAVPRDVGTDDIAFDLVVGRNGCKIDADADVAGDEVAGPGAGNGR